MRGKREKTPLQLAIPAVVGQAVSSRTRLQQTVGERKDIGSEKRLGFDVFLAFINDITRFYPL